MKKLLSSLAILPFLATPAMADISQQFNNESSATEACVKRQSAGQGNYFWGRNVTASWNKSSFKLVNTMFIHQGKVYQVGSMKWDLQGNVIGNSLCDGGVGKGTPLNSEQTSFNSNGTLVTTLWKQENNLIDLVKYVKYGEGPVSKTVYTNFAYTKF